MAGLQQHTLTDGTLSIRATYRDADGTPRRLTKDPKTGKPWRCAPDAAPSTVERLRASALAAAKAIEDGYQADPSIGKETWAAIHEARIEAEGYASNTLASLHQTWNLVPRGLQHRQARKVSSVDIDRVLAKINSVSMRERARINYSGDFSWAMAQEPPLATSNPAKARRKSRTRSKRAGDTRVRKADVLTEDWLARLFAAVEGHALYMPLRLQRFMALRPGEVLALEVGDFDPMHRTISVERGVDENDGLLKTQKSRRTLRLPRFLADELAGYLASEGIADQPRARIFRNSTGSARTVRDYRHAMYRACVRAGIEQASPNQLRHVAVSWAIKHAGADVFAVQRMCGHERPAITLDVYGDLLDTGQDDLADRMDAAYSGETAVADAEVVAIREGVNY
jgi:integrase